MSSKSILTQSPGKADVRLTYGNEPYQFGDLRLPKGSGIFPVVMNIHGGYWRSEYDLSHAGHICEALTMKGFATWNVEYRRVGNIGGGWPGTMEDIKNSYGFLSQIANQYHLDLQRIIVMGHSAGGHLALYLAAHDTSVKNVISLAGVVNLQRAWESHLSQDAVVDLLGGSPNEVPQHYEDADPMRLAIPNATQWLIHGLMDDIVPPELSRDYVTYKKSRGENANLIELADADHFDVINPLSLAWQKIEHMIRTL